MKKVELARDYDFYDLEEEERKKLIGCYFEYKKSLYFPVQLAFGEFNYGIQQGLIFISPVWKHGGAPWFRVAAFSPDDLDMDLDFKNNECKIRSEVVEYVKKMSKDRRTYADILEEIRSHFNMGKRTS